MAPVVTDLVGGHMPLGVIDPPSAMSAIEGGLISPIAVSSATRYQRLPDVPTFAEQGVPGFEATGWFGIVAPAATPNDVIAKLNAAFVTALKDPAIVERIRALGSDPLPMSPQEFSRFIESEARKWETVAAKAGKKIELVSPALRQLAVNVRLGRPPARHHGGDGAASAADHQWFTATSDGRSSLPFSHVGMNLIGGSERGTRTPDPRIMIPVL